MTEKSIETTSAKYENKTTLQKFYSLLFAFNTHYFVFFLIAILECILFIYSRVSMGREWQIIDCLLILLLVPIWGSLLFACLALGYNILFKIIHFIYKKIPIIIAPLFIGFFVFYLFIYFLVKIDPLDIKLLFGTFVELSKDFFILVKAKLHSSKSVFSIIGDQEIKNVLYQFYEQIHRVTLIDSLQIALLYFLIMGTSITMLLRMKRIYFSALCTAFCYALFLTHHISSLYIHLNLSMTWFYSIYLALLLLFLFSFYNVWIERYKMKFHKYSEIYLWTPMFIYLLFFFVIASIIVLVLSKVLVLGTSSSLLDTTFIIKQHFLYVSVAMFLAYCLKIIRYKLFIWQYNPFALNFLDLHAKITQTYSRSIKYSVVFVIFILVGLLIFKMPISRDHNRLLEYRGLVSESIKTLNILRFVAQEINQENYVKKEQDNSWPLDIQSAEELRNLSPPNETEESVSLAQRIYLFLLEKINVSSSDEKDEVFQKILRNESERAPRKLKDIEQGTRVLLLTMHNHSTRNDFLSQSDEFTRYRLPLISDDFLLVLRALLYDQNSLEMYYNRYPFSTSYLSELSKKRVRTVCLNNNEHTSEIFDRKKLNAGCQIFDSINKENPPNESFAHAIDESQRFYRNYQEKNLFLWLHYDKSENIENIDKNVKNPIELDELASRFPGFKILVIHLFASPRHHDIYVDSSNSLHKSSEQKHHFVDFNKILQQSLNPALNHDYTISEDSLDLVAIIGKPTTLSEKLLRMIFIPSVPSLLLDQRNSEYDLFIDPLRGQNQKTAKTKGTKNN